MTSLGILGATGRIGKTVLQLAQQNPHFTQIKTYNKHNFNNLKNDIKHLNLVIDFSQAAATLELLKLIDKNIDAKLVIGVTDLSSQHHQLMQEKASSNAIFYAANMSPGIALLEMLLAKTASVLNEGYDVEITDIHHRHKKDSPSGTALKLGDVIAQARGNSFDEVKQLTKSPEYVRINDREISFNVSRIGEIFGEHKVSFTSANEQFTLSHTSFNKEIFAQGALKAALWLLKQQPGLYSTQNLYKF